MIKGLEAYKLFLDDVEQCVQSGGIHYIDRKNRDIIKKELKALEIIKKVFDSSSTYTNKLKDSLECGWITQEEFDLLKEVLL